MIAQLETTEINVLTGLVAAGPMFIPFSAPWAPEYLHAVESLESLGFAATRLGTDGRGNGLDVQLTHAGEHAVLPLIDFGGDVREG